VLFVFVIFGVVVVFSGNNEIILLLFVFVDDLLIADFYIEVGFGYGDYFVRM